MHTLLLLVALAHGADVSTSLYAFHRGAGEADPIVLSTQPAAFTVQMAGGAAAELFVLDRVSRHHPTLAKTLAWVSVGVRGSVAAHNIAVARGEPRYARP